MRVIERWRCAKRGDKLKFFLFSRRQLLFKLWEELFLTFQKNFISNAWILRVLIDWNQLWASQRLIIILCGFKRMNTAEVEIPLNNFGMNLEWSSTTTEMERRSKF